ncbi:MAG: OsmC family protein [Anaerolineales bacterium]
MKLIRRESEMESLNNTVNVKWIHSTGTLMAGVDSRGTPAVIGMWSDHEPPWKGLKASDLLLMSAASCSTYDVVTILKKKREPLESLEVICTGEQESEPPNRFTHIHLRYLIKGEIKPDSIEKAIQLSEEKYCSVLNTLKGSVEITSEYEIVG